MKDNQCIAVVKERHYETSDELFRVIRTDIHGGPLTGNIVVESLRTNALGGRSWTREEEQTKIIRVLQLALFGATHKLKEFKKAPPLEVGGDGVIYIPDDMEEGLWKT